MRGVGGEDTARVAGDKFALLATCLPGDAPEWQALVERVSGAVSEPFPLDEAMLRGLLDGAREYAKKMRENAAGSKRPDATRVTENLAAAADRYATVSDAGVSMTAAIGVTVFPDDADDASLVGLAEKAMFAVKDLHAPRESGSPRWARWTPELSAPPAA